jgi:DNA polymerase III psi subunit
MTSYIVWQPSVIHRVKSTVIPRTCFGYSYVWFIWVPQWTSHMCRLEGVRLMVQIVFSVRLIGVPMKTKFSRWSRIEDLLNRFQIRDREDLHVVDYVIEIIPHLRTTYSIWLWNSSTRFIPRWAEFLFLLIPRVDSVCSSRGATRSTLEAPVAH